MQLVSESRGPSVRLAKPTALQRVSPLTDLSRFSHSIRFASDVTLVILVTLLLAQLSYATPPKEIRRILFFEKVGQSSATITLIDKEVGLPQDSIVINKQPSVWQAYERFILALIFLIVTETALILGLLWHRAKKRKVERSLRELLSFEQLVSDLSTMFISLPEEQVEVNIEPALGRIGNCLKLDRVTMHEFSHEKPVLLVSFAWRGDGIPPVSPLAYVDQIPCWAKRLRLGETVFVSNLDDLPGEASSERLFLERNAVKSGATVPLKSGNEVFGSVSFVTTTRRVIWTADLLKQLRVLAEIFSNALTRKRSLEALHRRDLELKEAQRLARLASWQWDPEIDKVVWSDELYRIAGLDPNLPAVNYKDHSKLYTPESWERLNCAIEEALRSGMPYELDVEMVRPDGSTVWLVARGEAVFDKDGRVVQLHGSVQDITERKKTEKALLDMSGLLITAHEEERTRIARELHDDLSQRMALLLIGLDQCVHEAGRLAPKTSQQLARVTEVAKEVSSSLHDMSHQLHPSKLETLGLVTSIGGFCGEFSRQCKIKIEFAHRDIPTHLSKDVTLCLFRIVQEALRNIVKHSGASEARVSLTGHDGGIDLCISDSGTGFDHEAAKRKASLGLISMRERLRLVGGKLAIESELPHGTKILVYIPLADTNATMGGGAKTYGVGA